MRKVYSTPDKFPGNIGIWPVITTNLPHLRDFFVSSIPRATANALELVL